MKKPVKLRPLTPEEKQRITQIANSRSEPHALVQRARLILLLSNNPNLYASEAGRQVGFRSLTSGVYWVKRFNAEGVAGLRERRRAGRKPTHGADVRQALLDLAAQSPEALGYPFAQWTVKRLQQAMQQRLGIHLSVSTIWEWLRDAGFRWRKQQSWFSTVEQRDPAYAQKRGRLLRHTRALLRIHG